QVLGRANATWRFLVFGAQPLGALLGGAIGATVGLRTALVVGSVGTLLAVAWATRSPLRSLRQIPAWDLAVAPTALAPLPGGAAGRRRRRARRHRGSTRSPAHRAPPASAPSARRLPCLTWRSGLDPAVVPRWR